MSLSATAASNFTGTFASANVGNGTVIAVTGGHLTGAQAGDYVLASPDEENGAVNANITAAQVNVNIIGDPTKNLRRHHNCHTDGGELRHALRSDHRTKHHVGESAGDGHLQQCQRRRRRPPQKPL